MTVKKIILTIIAGLSLMACSKHTVYSDYQSVPLDGWTIDSVVTFTIPVSDTVTPYDVILHVRHTDAYAYQNMWLFVNSDTIEFYLADDRGHWLGNGHNFKDMPVLYREQVVLKDSIYTLHIQQGMREEALKGISDIGVEIVR